MSWIDMTEDGYNRFTDQSRRDREMMEESESYVQGRFAQMILQNVGGSSTSYYDAAQLRAAFRAGFDYAQKSLSKAK